MKILKTKLVKRFVALIIVGLILGISLYFITNENEKLSISTTLINYINMIQNSTFNYGQSFFTSLVSNLKYLTIIWISGIIFVLFFIPPILLFLKSFIIGFSLTNIIAVFKIKGLIYAIILSLPYLLNILLLIIMSFYSIKFAIKTFKIIKNNTSINLKNYIKNYTIIYLILTFLLLINTLIETYIVPNILKLVS